MEKSSFKLFFLVFLLTVAVCHGATCTTDYDCVGVPVFCYGNIHVCLPTGKCGCLQTQQLNSQEKAPLHQTRKLLNM
ncbi:hypothetical protein Lalb_Chr19g0133061 [Lupinus albus]|uniref:Late nodulin n=1 Tax=Lupinus albus TaxID=3870 RepID=A0A6A4NTU1_LUPAL|nr:hypothetical protein Lalb_Chr19g0133061 [Lupinus albus]